MSTYRFSHVWYASLALLALTACSSSGHNEGQRTEEAQRRYTILNDSMQHLAPHVLDTIKAEMQRAEDSLTWYDYYLMYGRHYLQTSTPDSTLPYVERTLQFIRNIATQTPRTRGLAAMALNSKGAYHYMMHHDADSVVSLFHQAYDLMTQSDMKQSLPDVSANIGDAYVEKNDMPEATRWYRRALVLDDSLGLPNNNELTLYMGLGRIYTTLHDFEQAKYYYEMTDEHFDNMKPNMQSYFLNNYGNYFYYHREYSDALKTFRRLKAHLEKYYDEDYFDMYLCKINMADVFLNLNQTDSAHHYVNEVEDFFKKNHINIGVYYANTIRIGIALQEKQYKEVERIVREEGKANIVDEGMLDIRNGYMNRYYAAIGDYQRAYAGLRGNQEKSDSAEYHRKHMRSSEIMTRLTEDTIRMHHQLEMNKREILYAKSRTMFWMIVVVLLVIIFGFTVWISYERKRRLQNHLDMLLLRLSNARQRVSPHFVFNVLNSRILKSDGAEADQLMQLARLIRTNLDLTHKEYVTLAEELDFVSQYVNIVQNSSGINFDFRIEAPEQEVLEQIKIPSMLVQILVENAILHGLKNKQGGDKCLSIHVDTNKQATRVSVVDNGPGFDIRHNSERLRTGLNIIRTTVATINQENPKAKMRFDIKNENGCHATLTIPMNINYPNIYESNHH